MDVRILGPIEVWDGGRQWPLGGPMQRALLVDLVLHANHVVPADRLIDDLWHADSSSAAISALRVSVSRLRKALPADVVSTRTPGYLIRLGPDQVDLHRFERLVEDARHDLARGAAAVAADRLRRALMLWRGQALAEVAYESFAEAAIARLEEIRIAAHEMRIEADLACGLDRELVGELEALIVDHPLRERLRQHLMLALYRSGRQADALEAFQQARRVLAGELGIDPSPALQALQGAILRQDPALATTQPARRSVDLIPERTILVAVADEAQLDHLLAIAEPLARHSSRVLIMCQIVPAGSDLESAAGWLHERRAALVAGGVVARAAAFTSQAPGVDLARMAAELDVELILLDGLVGLLADGRLDDERAPVLTAAPCDVAVAVRRDAAPVEVGQGAVLVPFGGDENDWAAVELGAWLATAHDVPLRLVGAAAVQEDGRRDASRLLSHASLAVQRVLGVPAEPILTEPGADGVLAASQDAGLLVVGLSSRWDREGLGPARTRIAREARPPILFVRRGVRPGGLAPPAGLTRFPWSIRA